MQRSGPGPTQCVMAFSRIFRHHFEWGSLLERATDLLSTRRDYEATVTQIANLAAQACDGWCSVDLLELMTALGSKSYLCLPLKTRDETVGAILLVSVSRRFSEVDVVFAGKLAHIFAVAVDCARLFRQMNAAIKLRDDFISIAAHELRTPLTPLRMQSEFISKSLEKENISEGAKQRIGSFVKISDGQIKRLTQLVNDLLDASRINSHQMDLRLSETDLLSVIRNAMANLADSAEKARCTFEISCSDSVRGYWDSSKLEQVFVNLFPNAIK